MDPTRLIAHRGWQRRYPENTLPALRGALEIGALNLEIDVQLSSDCQPMLFHDHTLRRICRQKGAIHRYSRDQLRPFSAHEPKRFGDTFLGTPIPHLDEVVELLAQFPEAHLFLELKPVSVQRFGPETVCDAVAAAVEALGARCTLISFSLPVLQVAADRGWRVGPVLNDWAQLHSPQLAALDPAVVFADVLQLPAGPIASPWPLAVYEVDQPAQVEALWARGVQWVETFAVGELLGAAP
jgi:glycerophosphoryl diester phosphodiesterase